MTRFDPATLSPADLEAAAAEAARRARAVHDSLLAELPGMTDDQLRTTIDAFERETGTDEWDCDRSSDPDHGQGERSRCPACAARALLERRAYLDRAKAPGANPHVYIPDVQTVTAFWRAARDLRVGDVAEHLPRPGTKAREHVEAVDVSCDGPVVTVTWRRTNDPDATPFQTTYPADESVDVTRLAPVSSVRPVTRRKA